MQGILTSLLRFVLGSARTLLEFLAIFMLGIVWIVLFALPWLLRLFAVLLWLAAGYIGITKLDELYSPYISSPIPLFALQFALIILMVATPMVGMLRKPEFIWGALAVGGFLIGIIFWMLVPWLLQHWDHARLFFRILPSAIYIVLLIAATLRLKRLQLITKGGDPSP